MCIIFACWNGTPSDADLRIGAESNRDGAGVAWVDLKKNPSENRTYWIKGLDSDPEQVKKVLKKEKIKFPYAIHFRTASIGGNAPELTHPFPYTEDSSLDLAGVARRVIMHNGHWSGWKHMLLTTLLTSPHKVPPGIWSDSRALAVIGAIKGEPVWNLLDHGSRIMLLDSLASKDTDEANPRNYFRLYGTGWIEEDAGYATSCPLYKRYDVRMGGKIVDHTKKDDDNKVCELPSKRNDVTYTIEELDEILAELRKEQIAAKNMASLSTGH